MTTWRINPTAKTNGRNSLMVESEMGVPIAEVKMQYTGSGKAIATPDKAEQQKNAELIAAAPYLLAEAKKAAEFLKSDEPISESQFKLLVGLTWAIERAGGEA